MYLLSPGRKPLEGLCNSKAVGLRASPCIPLILRRHNATEKINKGCLLSWESRNQTNTKFWSQFETLSKSFNSKLFFFSFQQHQSHPFHLKNDYFEAGGGALWGNPCRVAMHGAPHCWAQRRNTALQCTMCCLYSTMPPYPRFCGCFFGIWTHSFYKSCSLTMI